MTAPDETVPENPEWLALAALPRPHRDVEFPRTKADGTRPLIHLQVLSQEEIFAARAQATKFAREVVKAEKAEGADVFARVYEDAAAIELLFRACKRVENPKWPFFPGAPVMRKNLSQDETAVLMREYLLTQAQFGPIVGEMTEEEVDHWIERIARSGSRFPFGSLSLEATALLLQRMASRLSPSSTATSSSGSPPASESDGETASESSPEPPVT